ncbi:non-ribosomal peptide synthetase [Archangium lansingense]|uniref:Amino acid adenylation domain-containing protein n=1 Tax=Archangium lansingense TaxID=2995310 RepID=A0ABT4A2U4_9BACT|nr:non-ribosomal peptide synthetase [Archangium lansinium]MCY1075972.1 amino acid adenylation domain-containing protein [Archangium lansinium]
MHSTPPTALATGTEYERLLSSLRLKGPWAIDAEPSWSTPPEGVDRARIAARVRDNRRDHGPWRSVLDVLEQQARLHADRVALSDAALEVTYAQLRKRTSALAGILRARGLGRGDVVAVVMDRGPAFVETVLAVWKCGAAYLPLTPAHPAAWREDVIRRAGAVLVVGLSQASAMPGVPYLELGSAPVTLEPALEDAPGGAALTPEDLAYIICTSGSTGEPKLVMLEHRGVSHLLQAQRDFLGELGKDMRVLQFAHPAFDGALFELVLALANGGRLEFIDDTQLSGDPLAQVLLSRRVTHAVLPAAVLRTLRAGRFTDLQVVMSVGDVCLPETARQWAAFQRFVNGYGPAEATVCTTLHPVEAQDGERVPIGRPISNCHVVILDEHLQPVPDGTPGEICIGGDGVGRGYLGQPGLTAERFVQDPFSPVPGSRLYRSGDLGRQLADGTIEFLGRRDHQVKVRGVRIETGQVEAALAALPGVRDAVAVIDGTGERLLGYVIPAAGTVLSADGLRAELRRLLPGYLVPDVIVPLDEWPLNTSGKVDRARLPRPQRPDTTGYQPPRTPVEAALVRIAAELLGMESVGVHDNLFELGGHSLFATQLVARARGTLGAQLELSAVLQAPTVAGIAAAIGDRLDRAELGPRAAEPGTGVAPSYAQQRVWLMHKLNPDARAYHTQAVLRLAGDLDITALHASLSDIIRRHSALRTRLPEVDGELTCEVDPPWEVEVPLRDFSDADEARQETLVGEAVRDMIQAPFSLADGRPFRWLLLRLSAQEHVFVHVEHHIVHDGWSFNVFVRDLLNGYADFVRHGRVRRPDLSVQYSDYARWQREWSGTEAAAAQRRFWRQELEGAETVLQLPRRAEPGSRKFRGMAPRMELDGELARRLQALADRNHTSLFNTLLAAFFVLLHRYTGSRDILVGSGVANRRWQDTENLLGMFVNNVVLRGRLHGDPTFEEFLAQVRRTTLAAYDHQELPYEMLFAESPARHHGGLNPLIQAMFSFHDASLGTLSEAPLEVSVVEGLSNGSAKFELSVIAVPRYSEPGHISRLAGNVVRIPRSDAPVRASPRSSLCGITLAWEFDSDLFEEFFIAGMLSAYQRLLHAITAAPDTPVSRLPLLDDAGRQALVVTGPRSDAPAEWLPDLIKRQAERTPDAPAVTSGNAPMSYRELTFRAERLARHLRGMGIGRGDVVAVCAPHSAELVVSQLGVLQSGAAYLPLDPSHPPSRLELLVQDAGARAVITTAELAHRVPGLPTVVLEDVPDSPDVPLPSGVPTDLAYVIYTSGSTGRPKGVQIEHRSVVARLYEMEALGLVPGKTVLAAASVAFDVSVLELWGALLNGAAIHFLKPGWDMQGMARCLTQQSITHAFLSPAVFHSLVAELPEVFDAMERVMVGGDVVSPDAFRALRRRGFTKVANLYGPTETTIVVSGQRLEDWHDVEGARVPIGRALSNSQLVVLDEHLQVVPPGVVGEICIGGPVVGRGYLGMPELTSERFVANPFGTLPGGRLYRSGDLGRWLPGGVIDFLGRRDDQVKIRGVRVELSEVRTALAAHPGVTDAVALADRTVGEVRLIGYVVAAPGSAVSGQAVREDVARRLPGHLVPGAVLVLDAWPLTTNGKLDRSRLPKPQVSTDTPFTAPRNEAEARIAALVTELLKVDRVGVHDSLFELGMHSLQAMKLATRLSRMTGREVALATVFAGPTVAQLAEALTTLPPARPAIGKLPRT